MSEAYVQFHRVEDIVDFVTAASKCVYAVDLSCGRFGADGKSLMGVMAIGLDKPVRVEMQAEDRYRMQHELERYGI